MNTFQCSKKHRWPDSESSHCPQCHRPSDDIVVFSWSEMCPSCAVRGKLWHGVSGRLYCDHCDIELEAGLNQVERLQKILDFKKNRAAL